MCHQRWSEQRPPVAHEPGLEPCRCRCGAHAACRARRPTAMRLACRNSASRSGPLGRPCMRSYSASNSGRRKRDRLAVPAAGPYRRCEGALAVELRRRRAHAARSSACRPASAFRFSGHLAKLNSTRMPIAAMFFCHSSSSWRSSWLGQGAAHQQQRLAVGQLAPAVAVAVDIAVHVQQRTRLGAGCTRSSRCGRPGRSRWCAAPPVTAPGSPGRAAAARSRAATSIARFSARRSATFSGV